MHDPYLNTCQSKTSGKILMFYIENAKLRFCRSVVDASVSHNEKMLLKIIAKCEKTCRGVFFFKKLYGSHE